MTNEIYVSTSHGVLAYEESRRNGLPVVLIHGNSSCRDVFRKQLEGNLFSDYRLIAVDLPGHGRSEDAINADQTYTLPGLAEAVSELLSTIRVLEPVVFGWSLGGHIAIEMLAHSINMRSLLLCGTPPVGKIDGRNNMAEGFNNPPSSLPAQDRGMNKSEARSFVGRLFRGTGNDILVGAAVRTDGRFRRRLIESSLAGLGTNQKHTIESAQIPMAIFNGAEDNLIKADFFRTVMFQDLWEDKIHAIENAGHAPFWEQPVDFNLKLGRFLSFARKSMNAR